MCQTFIYIAGCEQKFVSRALCCRVHTRAGVTQVSFKGTAAIALQTSYCGHGHVGHGHVAHGHGYMAHAVHIGLLASLLSAFSMSRSVHPVLPAWWRHRLQTHSHAVCVGRRIIDSMHHKLTFLRNPRFPSPQKHSRASPAGPAHAESARSHAGSRQASPTKVSSVSMLHLRRFSV